MRSHYQFNLKSLVILPCDSYLLRNLLTLSDSQLDKEQRTTIWTAVHPYLSTLINNGEALLAFFQLAECQLDKKQRSDILNSVKSELGRLINDSDFISDDDEDVNYLFKYDDEDDNYVLLMKLLTLSDRQLDKEQRIQILTALQPDLCKKILMEGKLNALLTPSEKQFITTQGKCKRISLRSKS